MKKILVAEDSPTVLAIIKSVLEDAGYSVVTASDGQEALNKAKTEKPDLFILDLMLPKVDGYKVCGILKFDRNFADKPVIILTARAGDSDKDMAKDVKADDYVTKPFEPSLLIPKIKKFLKEE